MKQKLIVSLVVIVVLGTVILGTTKAFAQSPTNWHASIIEKLVQKFGLKQADVQAVFDESMKDRQAQMQTRIEDRLTQAVKDGKLTEAQKQLILTKQQELKTKREAERQNLQNMTPQLRRDAFAAQKQEIESWAKQNNIDLNYFFGGFRGGMRGLGKHIW